MKKKLRCLDKIEFLNTSSDENTIVGSYKIESPSCDHTKQQKERKSLSSPIYQESENGPERILLTHAESDENLVMTPRTSRRQTRREDSLSIGGRKGHSLKTSEDTMLILDGPQSNVPKKVSKFRKKDNIVSDPACQTLINTKAVFEKLSPQNNITEAEYQDQIQKDMDIMNSYESSGLIESYDSFKGDNCQTILEEINNLITELQELYQDKWDLGNGST